MPNATLRATAAPLPKAEPSTDTLGANAPASPKPAFHGWLVAIAGVEEPDVAEDRQSDKFEAEHEAGRRLFTTPAVHGDQVWQKLTAFEHILGDELMSGQRRNSVLMLALGSIKQDLINLEMLESI